MAKKNTPVNEEVAAPDLTIADEPPKKSKKNSPPLGEVLRQFITIDDGEPAVDPDFYFAGLNEGGAAALRDAVDMVNSHNDRILPAMAVEVSRVLLDSMSADLDDGARVAEEVQVNFYGGQILKVGLVGSSPTSEDDKPVMDTIFGYGRKTAEGVWEKAQTQVNDYWSKLLADKN